MTEEIRRARKVEGEENRRKLFPIRLVDFESIQKWECFDAESVKDLGVELREYYIPDFSNWKDHDAFEAEFAKLLRDLKAQRAELFTFRTENLCQCSVSLHFPVGFTMTLTLFGRPPVMTR